jgi:hypothetical protein
MRMYSAYVSGVHAIGCICCADDGLWPDDVPAPVLALPLCNEKILLEEVFPEPESWKPERWLNANKRMELNWVPFGTSCRACPGANLAVTELKSMIGTAFRSFQSVVPPGHGQDVLELAGHFCCRIKDRALLVKV